MNSLKGKVKKITMERTMCYGPCPVFKVTLKDDGNCIYEGRDNVNKIGIFTGRLEERDFQRLVELMERLGFLELNDNYISAEKDHASVITEIDYDGGLKRVNNYADSGPVQIWAIERVIDSIAEDLYWEEAKSII